MKTIFRIFGISLLLLAGACAVLIFQSKQLKKELDAL